MSGELNGHSARRPKQTIEAVVHSLAEWRDQHQADCVEGSRAVSDRLEKVETTVTRMSGQVDLLVTAFIREKDHPDGSKSVLWKLPKFSGKTILGMVGSFGGGVLLLQMLIVMGVPAFKAWLEWVLHYGH